MQSQTLILMTCDCAALSIEQESIHFLWNTVEYCGLGDKGATQQYNPVVWGHHSVMWKPGGQCILREVINQASLLSFHLAQ